MEPRLWQMRLEMKRDRTRKVPEHQAKEAQTFFWGVREAVSM